VFRTEGSLQDSFDPGHGVLFTKIRTRENSSCGTFSCFVWIVDSHAQDIDKVDFIGPDGTPNMMTMGDQRQLDDATFNAGLNSGTAVCGESNGNTGGTVPATLSLSTGTPAGFGPFLPGQGREYTATTTAGVTSTHAGLQAGHRRQRPAAHRTYGKTPTFTLSTINP
jgi:hypothetical protein